MDIKEAIKKSWNWIWNDDSVLSWIVSLILAFVVVKFVFFPIISLIFATSLPLVVVESSSMHHSGNCLGNALGLQSSFDSWWTQAGAWYEQNNITEEQAEKWPLRTGFDKGDIMIIFGYRKPKVGDVIVFNANVQYPIIHRVIKITEINGKTYYSTKGDNNSGQLDAEKQISEDAVIGKAVIRLPLLGWIKLWAVDIWNSIFG